MPKKKKLSERERFETAFIRAMGFVPNAADRLFQRDFEFFKAGRRDAIREIRGRKCA